MSHGSVQLGLGLIGIGKPWGHAPAPVPSEREALALLESAWDVGIRYFDTGRFLKQMPAEQRSQVTVATKFGEHWDRAAGAPYADHSFDALRRSVDQSQSRLGAIEILQLHKTTPQALASAEVARAWEYAQSLGIRRLGPSVSDLESGRLAVEDGRYSVMQLPFNRENTAFGDILDRAGARGMWIAVNRPFAMGAMVHAGADKREAFRFILERHFQGVILTGTTSPEHLKENWRAFAVSCTLWKDRKCEHSFTIRLPDS
jgi:aryl-alcohol dehydrogenase-like predicted oxidoreductase